MYNQSDQGCCWQPQGQHNYRLFVGLIFVCVFPKDAFLCPPFEICLHCLEIERDVQGHLERQEKREKKGRESNGRDQVTNNLTQEAETGCAQNEEMSEEPKGRCYWAYKGRRRLPGSVPQVSVDCKVLELPFCVSKLFFISNKQQFTSFLYSNDLHTPSSLTSDPRLPGTMKKA